MLNKFPWIFLDAYIKSLGWSCWSILLRRLCCTLAVLGSYPVSQDCMPTSLHFVSAHWVFPSLSTSLLQTCVGAKDSIPDPFQSYYEKLPHSLTIFPISVKWQCKKALCSQGWKKYPPRIFDFPSDFLLYSQLSKISPTIILHVWNFLDWF